MSAQRPNQIASWDPRYVAYAATNSNTPDAQIESDQVEFPGGCMCGFICWISLQTRRYRLRHPERFIGLVVADQAHWTEFLQSVSA